MTEQHAKIVSIMVHDFADWNGKMWELHNKNYTPEQIAGALNALAVEAGDEPTSGVTDCTPLELQ